MTLGSDVQERLRRYLLGAIDDETRPQIEQEFLVNDDLFEELLILEDELIDDYLNGNLSADDRANFEKHFLSTPQRAEQLKFGRAFRRHLSHETPAVSEDVIPEDEARRVFAEGRELRHKKSSTAWWTWPPAFLGTPWRAAAFAGLIVGIVFGLWWLFLSQSAVDESLLALNSAFREQRPLESRISNFTYAPYVVIRSPADEKFDREELQRAELISLEEVKRNPTPQRRHAVGRVYLAKKDFDEAIKQLSEALKGDPNNAHIYSDLGAAWLEKGKLGRHTDAGKGLVELGRGLEHLNKALELNPNLLEALFNRALCYEYMMAGREAEAGWKEYLQKDQSSPWADDARRRLKRLEENKAHTSWNTGSALSDFLAAYARGDDDAAWNVVTRNYTSAGNEVTNRLLDAVLEPGQQSGINASPSALTYLAKLEFERASDRYTSDLVHQLEREMHTRREDLADTRRMMRDAYSLFKTLKFKDAIAKYSEAKRIYEGLDNVTGQLFVEYRLAHCYLFLKDLQQAELIFKRLSLACAARNYHWLNAQCLYGLSHASYDQRHYSRAINYSEEALTHYERVADRNGAVKVLTQIAQANQVLNRIERALRYLNRALELSTNAQIDPTAKWGMFQQFAFDMRSLGFHHAALVYQREALEVALQTGNSLSTSRAYGNLGFQYAALRKYDDALEAVTRAAQTGEAMGDNPAGREIVAHASQQVGEIYRQAGDCGKAIENYNKSMEIYSQLEIDYYSYAAHKGKLFCFIVNNDDRSAAEILPKVLNLFDEYRPKITDESQRVSFFANQQSVYDLAIYFKSVRQRDATGAFEFSEASRARALLDGIGQGAKVLKKNNEPQINLPAASRSASLAEIQKKMPGDTQILQYAVLDDRLLMWLVTPSAIHPVEVAITSEALKEKVQALLNSVHKPSVNPTGLQGEATDLYKILIAPVEPLLEESRYLCVVPDKILHYVPYQALVSPSTGRFFVEDYNFGSAPSATIFVDLSGSARAKTNTLDEQLLSVGNPHFNYADFDNLPDLASAAQEARAIATFYAKSRVLLHNEATETAVRTEIVNADVAHLAMHYVVNDQMETLSGFPLTPNSEGSSENDEANGFLQSYEIYNLRLPRTRLVVLSACQTGIEQHYAGEGAIGAARQFLVAGVPTVVASLWAIDSEASAELMASFHRHRRDRLPVASALRRAQIEMARGDNARYRHPYYWAAFQMIGGQYN